MRILLVLALAALLAGAAAAQSVISVRAGIVNDAEGAVFINGQPLSKKFGTFPSLHEGSDLYTQDGRAELQLAPSVFLRVGTDSAVRMVSSNLSDTRIQILNGSAIFDSGNSGNSGNAPSPGSVTLLAADASIFIEAPSRMRVDADPPQLRVEKGAARVTRNGIETVVQADQMLPLSGESIVRRMTTGNDDSLDLWSLERNRMIYLSLSTSQSLLDPAVDADPTAPADLSALVGYMPYSGVFPVSGVYSTVQPVPSYTYAYGYNSYFPAYSRAYLPGIYTGYSAVYRPAFLTYRPGYITSPSLSRPPLYAPRPIVTRPVAPRPVIHK